MSPALLGKPSSEAQDSELGLMISPMPNMTSTTFIAGPNISVRDLHLPLSAISVWLRTYRSKIDRAAHKMMKVYPPKDHCETMYLSLTEFVTETWRTIFIRTGPNPSPVALGWRSAPNDGLGVWSILEQPNSSSVISGGRGSFPVCSLIINSNGLNRTGLSGHLEATAFQ
jgi:hypothetical protein